MIPAPLTFRAIVATLSVAGVLALGPAVAHAGPYTVDYCRNFDNSAPLGFVFGTLIATGGQQADSCNQVNPTIGLYLQNIPLPAGGRVSFDVEIPAAFPNLQMTQVQTEYAARNTTGSASTVLATGAGATLVTHPGPGPITAVDTAALPAGTRRVHWETDCAVADCSFVLSKSLELLRTRFTVTESVNPTVTVPANGLTSPGPVSGTQTLVYDAHDADAGVGSVTVTLDGVLVGTSEPKCEHNFWSVCPRDVVGQQVEVDTTKVPNGVHELAVTVRDAANNGFTRTIGNVTVVNAVPLVAGPGLAPGALVGAPNGTGATRLAKLTARFTSTSKTSRTVGFDTKSTVTGALAGEGGRPITGATIAILARPRAAGAVAAQIATAQTGADGGFAVTLPGGPSRTFTFAYTASAGDATPATITTLRTKVPALVSARIAPRSVRAGNSIALSGRLALLPRAGIEVKIQARQGSTWRTVDEVRTTKTGTFRWRYRFPATQARRVYTFRVRVASPIYPFAAANSKTVLVRVR